MADPRGAYSFLDVFHDLGVDAAAKVLSFGCVLQCLFLLRDNFSSRNSATSLEGVHRRVRVKGAVCSRSSKTLDREHRWNNAVFLRERVQ